MLLLSFRIVLGICLLVIMAEPAEARDYAITVYGGCVTDDRWLESLSLNTDFVDAGILVVALSRTIKHLQDGAFTLEVEGQAARYFGDQDHLEFNIPLALRWHHFSWQGSVDTSLAFGMGPSWAAEDPRVELMTHDTTSQLLVYWFLEIALGPPDAHWAIVFRLHHRSTGFGAVAEDGGANTLAMGVKYRF
jgi:hypothetical protein